MDMMMSPWPLVLALVCFLYPRVCAYLQTLFLIFTDTSKEFRIKQAQEKAQAKLDEERQGEHYPVHYPVLSR